MFVDYREKVVLAYHKKREANPVSMNLLQPTPAKLKDECLNVYRDRPLPKDENTIRSFFGSKEEATDYGQCIKKIETDKFKPLRNFLRGNTIGTDDKNIELLAWLIDFEPRPYRYGYNYKNDAEAAADTESLGPSEKTENENSGIAIITSAIGFENENSNHDKLIIVTGESSADVEEVEIEKIEEVLITIPVGENKSKGEVQVIKPGIQTAFGKIGHWRKTTSKAKVRNVIIASIAIVIVISGSSLFISTKDQQCMYWTGTRYKPIACNQTIAYTPIIALDTIKVSRFHRITHPDTLTKYSLNRVWYARIDGKLEFYTSDGFHPVENDKRLRPLTPYILYKYIIKK